MRDFETTPEPEGKKNGARAQRIFVIHKHLAAHLHYDLRLEMDGVLKSWAIPKGPSLDPSVKRLAMEVEDHPYDYKDFEGTIPEGNYGAGEVIVWDAGTYHPAELQDGQEETLRKGLHSGHLNIVLEGRRLRGEFALIRMRKQKQWLFVKKYDEHAEAKRDITQDDSSVLSHRHLPDRQ